MRKEVIENLLLILVAFLLAPWLVLLFGKYYDFIEGVINR
ncbi:hypothetical protein LCGC14_3125300 [marine sediment metagenome]|uniref:Uncharacterized protein n=1 Tax=marine sediment metagenome TaxID=412755 RepID=A0A0F8YQY3_9ZZZZ